MMIIRPTNSHVLNRLHLISLHVSYADDDIHFTTSPSFHCGNLGISISYPFWTDSRSAYCGYGNEAYKLKCIPENQPPVMTLGSQEFQVMNLNQSGGLITIRRMEFGDNYTCPQEILINNAFNYTKTSENITLFYNCRSRGLGYTCKKGGRERSVSWFKSNEHECDADGEKVEIPAGKKAFDELMNGLASLNETLLEPFDMKYFAYDDYCKQCKDSGGRCGPKQDLPSKFLCYCHDRPHQLKCKTGMPASYFHFH
ncbi:hypothetical protein PTKIN_Ptkin05aG0135200 [Pterospermum kingtungense]